MTRNFPFTIRQVAKILQIKIRYDNPDNGNLDTDCPFCKKESKMNLNAEKNVFRCNSCKESGGMIQLYAKVYGISNSDANREICEILGCSNKASADTKSTSSPMQKNRADKNTLHQTYSMLLSMLVLTNPHREHLLNRGLSNEQIDTFIYKSVPAFGQQRLCASLLQHGCILDGVPGFYKANGEWHIKPKAPGILIPVRGINGNITGMQIRVDKPINGRKYIWFSSKDLDGGTSPGAPVHFIGDPAAKQVYVTNGALKGSVAYALTGHSFICLPDAKNLSGLDNLLSHLKANGTTEVLEAFDMKKTTDKQAGEYAANLRKWLSTFGFKVTSAVWGDKSHESIDDYFLHRMMKKRNHVYDVDISAVAAA